MENSLEVLCFLWLNQMKHGDSYVIFEVLYYDTEFLITTRLNLEFKGVFVCSIFLTVYILAVLTV